MRLPSGRADLVHERLQRLGSNVINDHPAAEPRHLYGHQAPHPASTSGDDDVLSCDLAHVPFPFKYPTHLAAWGSLRAGDCVIHRKPLADLDTESHSSSRSNVLRIAGRPNPRRAS